MLEILKSKNKKYIEDNNLGIIIDYLNGMTDKEDLVRVRLCDEYIFVNRNGITDVLDVFITENLETIINEESLYQETMIYSEDELKEEYNEEYEEEIIELINKYNDYLYNYYIETEEIPYQLECIFNCLRYYISEKETWIMYPYSREMVLIDNFGYEDYNPTSKTIEDIITLAKQLMFKFKFIS